MLFHVVKKFFGIFAVRMGLEPMISRVTGGHPLQLDQRTFSLVLPTGFEPALPT